MVKNKIIIGMIAGIISMSLLISPVNAGNLEEQLAESNEKQAAVQYQIDMTQNTIAGIETAISEADAEIDRISGVIDTLNSEIAQLEATIVQTQKEIEVAEVKLKEQEEAMNERVRTMYMYGNSSMVEFLFTSTDFSDFVTKIDMSRYIIESDNESLQALEETRKLIDDKKKSIEADRLATVQKKSEQQDILGEQESIKAQKNELLAQNQAIVEEAKVALNAEEATAADIQSQMQALLAQQNTGGSTTGGSGTFVPSNGSYQWPLPGYGPSAEDDYFGNRFHPIWQEYRFHSGVDMAAPGGTPLLAMGNGQVILAGWNGGYGQSVIIDLGNGIQALYAHMSSINVSVGETVNQGDVLGGVGTTGSSTGNHLHFGIYSGGDWVDPLGYF
jgi:murein DD-endopeptidase MepM/ murein hydrolase activator NlpD